VATEAEEAGGGAALQAVVGYREMRTRGKGAALVSTGMRATLAAAGRTTAV